MCHWGAGEGPGSPALSVFGPLSHHWFESPESPSGLGAVPLPVALLIYCAGSWWTFPIQGAFVLPVALLSTLKTDPFSVRQWL